MLRPTLISIFLLVFSKEANAGLDKYSYLDKIGTWTIERKIDSLTKTVSCRASILSKGTWFSSRIRLNKSDEVLYPYGLSKKEETSQSTIGNVKKALKVCRTGLIYLPDLHNE